jgi:uncharacterized protein involved in outer membrane biogenesis
MNNILLMLGALLVGILTALVAVPMMIDWNGYRGVFEEEASRLMGRDVRVSGPINVRVLPVPYVQFERLRVADPSSTGGDSLFRADNLTLRLSIAPLLRGVIEASHLSLKKPSLRLAADAAGGGNWRSLSLNGIGLPFAPSNVSLPSVSIEGGLLQFVGGTGQDLAQFDAIDGEFSAEGLDGPFKFKGTSAWYGAVRDVRLATTKPEADGTVRVRVNVRIPDNQNNYAFDGRILDWAGKPRIEGDLTAKLPLPSRAATGTVIKAPTAVDATAYELKSKVDADLNGGKLSGIELSLDDITDPQLITGDVSVAWGKTPKFDMALASKSLNFDRFAAEGAGVDPLGTARAVLDVVLASLPAEADTDARLKADRVTLAGDVVTGVSLAMSRRAGVLEVSDLRAVLPGSTRLDVSGAINNKDPKAFGFEGPISIRGAHLARFLAWSRKDDSGRKDGAGVGPSIPPSSGPPNLGSQNPGRPAGTPAASVGLRYDGPFALEGRIATSATTFDLTRVVGEFSDTPVSGELRINSAGRRRIGLVVEGPKLDFAEIWPGGLDLAKLRAVILGDEFGLTDGRPAMLPAPSVPGTGLYGYNPVTTDLKVEVRSGLVQTTKTTALRDVDAVFSVDNQTVDIKRVRFVTAAGLAVDVEGQSVPPAGTVRPANVSILPDGKPKSPAGAQLGMFRWVVGAPSGLAITEALNTLQWPLALRPNDAQIAAMGAVYLAGSARLGERGQHALDVAADGTLNGGRVTWTAKIDAALGDWRTHPVDTTLTLETTDLDRWASAMSGASGKRVSSSVPGRQGQVLFKATGIPQTGSTVLASLTGDGLSVTYQGAGSLPAEGFVALDGVAEVVARDANDVLVLAGLPLGVGPTGLGVSGRIALGSQDGATTFSVLGAKLGPTRLDGRATWSKPIADKSNGTAAAMRSLDATLTLDQATLSGLICAVCDRRKPSGDDPSIWPDQPLVLDGLEAWQGQVALTVRQLAFDGALGLKNATATVVVKPSGIEITDLVGSAFGGKVTSQFALAPSAGGATVTGQFGISDADLQALTPTASGPFGLTATVTSTGLSASSLVSKLQGRGDVTLGVGRIAGVGQSGLAATIDAVYAGTVPPAGEDLMDAVRTGLAKSTLPLGARTVGMSIKDGMARLDPLNQATADGQTGGALSLDLNRLRYALDWRINAVGRPTLGSVAGTPGPLTPALPPITLSQTGLLGFPATVEPILTLATFERDLAVRKLERDVQQLERLRKLDEERRLLEAERVKAEAAARAAGAAAAAAARPEGWVPLEVPAPVPAERPQTGSGAALPAAGGPEVPRAPDAVPAAAATTPAVPTPDRASADTPAVVGGSAQGPEPRDVQAPPETQPQLSRPSGVTRQPGAGPQRRRASEGIPQPLQNNF